MAFLQLTAIVVFASEVKAPGQAGTKPGIEATEDMIKIPAGKFIRGIDEDDPIGLVWASPRTKLHIDAYYIDKFEVTNAEYKKFVDSTGRRVPYDKQYDTLYNWKNGTYHKNFDDHPVVLVDFGDATEYCKWINKRLPTEAEWEKAARGIDGRHWPWGNEINVFNANSRDFDVRMTMPVGSFQEGASPFGVMDMAGNVFEWTSGRYKGYPGTKRKHPDYGKDLKVVRSGAWTSRLIPYAYTMSRTAQPPDYKHRSIGFRCASQ